VKKQKFNISIIRIAVQRSVFIISIYNIAMIAYLFTREAGFHWWYLFGVVGWFVLVIIDILIIYPAELNMHYRNSSDFQELVSDIKQIKERLGFIGKKIK